MEIYKKILADRITAMKNKDVEAKDVLSLLTSKIMNKSIELRVEASSLADAEVISILQKFIKEMEDEYAAFNSAGRAEKAASLNRQLNIIKAYLPKMLSEDEIRDEINKLEDKSMKSVMAHFKANFSGKVDMGLVSKIARGA